MRTEEAIPVEVERQAVQNVAKESGTAMARPQLSLLGGFQLGGETARTPALGRKARALLAYLALQSGHAQSREQLAGLLWGGSDDTHARVNLRQTLMEIRKALRVAGAPVLKTIGENMLLDLSGVDFDVSRFEKLSNESSPHQLEQAVSLYRGDLLDGFSTREEAFEEWLRVERERLRSLWIGVLDKLVGHYEAANLSQCIRVATQLLAAEPLREDVHRTLMRAYAEQKRFNLALGQYERCRAELQRHLQVQPQAETQELYRAIRARRAASTGIASPPSPPRPQTRYVNVGGINIAYQVTGDGPVDIVYVPGWVSNLDHAWTSPRVAHVFQRLGSFARLIRMDKRGTGLSDRNTGTPTLEELVEDLRAVLDAVGSQRAILFGSSEGGNMCMLFAAAHPARTSALILHGCSARGLWAPDYPWTKGRAEMESELAAIERGWGEPFDMSKAAPSLAGDPHEREWFASYLRNSASPADAISLWRWGTEIDVRAVLSSITAPTLVLRSAGDQWCHAGEARYLASHIAGARHVELPGDDHVIWGSHRERLLDEIESFVRSAPARPARDRVLLTVLNLELDAGGDQSHPGPLLHSAVREVRNAEGTLSGQTGNGIVAVFGRPTRALESARTIRHHVVNAGLSMRAVIHAGECEVQGGNVSGPAVTLAAGLIGAIPFGDIVATGTVRDLVVGSGLVFEPRPAGSSASLPDAVHLFAVR